MKWLKSYVAVYAVDFVELRRRKFYLYIIKYKKILHGVPSGQNNVETKKKG